jgi:microcystin degradation protein MlrC
MPRVLIAGLFHETHSFVLPTTTCADFESRVGAELLVCAGDASPLGGVLQEAAALGWDIIPAVDMRATPSGVVEASVVEFWWRLFETAARSAGAVDAVFLVLHGAMVSEDDLDVEGTLLRKMRELAPLANCLIAGVTDLHANVSPAMASLADALITYRCNPHTDARDSAIRAVRLLDRMMTSRIHPATVLEQVPAVLPPTYTGTTDDPMRSLEAMARRLETAPGVLAVNVHAGFAYADTPDTGFSITAIVDGDPSLAQAALRRIGSKAMAMLAARAPTDISLAQAIAQIDTNADGPTLLVEPADNIGGGAPGDATWILQALVAHKVHRSAVIINDPDAVAALSDKEVGTRATASIGGKSFLSGGPCVLDVEIVSRSDGKFDLEDRHSHLASMVGSHVSMGPCAVVRSAGVTILLTSLKTPPFDLGQLRSQGIVPEDCAVIGVKAAVAHRRAYDPIAKASFSVATPGACPSNLSLLPYRHVPLSRLASAPPADGNG